MLVLESELAFQMHSSDVIHGAVVLNANAKKAALTVRSFQPPVLEIAVRSYFLIRTEQEAE